MNAQRPKIRYTPLHRAIQRSGTVVAVPVLGGLCIIATRGYDFQIETEEDVASLGERFDLALAAMIGLLGASLALYLSRAVLPTI